MPDVLAPHEELRRQAAEALRVASVVPEGTRAALQKLATDLLAAAEDLEVAAAAEVARPDVKPPSRRGVCTV